MLVGRLELWTQRLFKTAVEMERCRCELADLGVMTGNKELHAGPFDAPKVIRLKEKLLDLDRDWMATCLQMEQAGVEVLNEHTLEVVIASGPKPGSYLSWMPGEPRIAWWREKKELDAPRYPLFGVNEKSAKPVLH
jgi:hypothetical protein